MPLLLFSNDFKESRLTFCHFHQILSDAPGDIQNSSFSLFKIFSNVVLCYLKKFFLPYCQKNVKRRNKDSTAICAKFFSKNKDKREICATLLRSYESR